jgi:nucleoside-diphosphate-sugar epimerase
MAARETILVLGGNAPARDVARALAAQSADRRVVFVATTAAASSAERSIDPASSTAARELAEVLLEVAPTTLVLLGLSQSPATPPQPWTSDAALADLVVSALDRHVELGGNAPELLFLTSTAVYGVAVSSPLVFDERSALPRESVFVSAHARWAEALRAVERRLVIWAVGAGVRVGVLRTASVLGGPMDSPVAALLSASVPVRVLGYDPPCQVIHYDDLVEAIVLAIDQHCGEVLNLVGRSVVPLSRLLAMAGVFAAPLPGPVADRLAPVAMDGAHLRWRTLADGRRATALLGFRPQRSLEDCLRAPR